MAESEAEAISPIIEIQPPIHFSRDKTKSQVQKHLYFRNIDKDFYDSSEEVSLTSEISSSEDNETKEKNAGSQPQQTKRESRLRKKKKAILYDEKSENEDFSHSTDSYKPSSESDTDKENLASNSQKAKYRFDHNEKQYATVQNKQSEQIHKNTQEKPQMNISKDNEATKTKKNEGSQPRLMKLESKVPKNNKAILYDEKSENEDCSHNMDSYKPSSVSDTDKENLAWNSKKNRYEHEQQQYATSQNKQTTQIHKITQEKPLMITIDQHRRSLSLGSYDQQEIDYSMKQKFNASDPVVEATTKNEIQTLEASSVVVAATTTNDIIRKWDKKQSCLYCSKLCAKLPRHLEAKHKNEPEVAKIMSYPVGSEERKLRLEELRKKGNFFHNTNVLKSGSGIIIPERRSKSTDAAALLPCPSCFGFYTKTKLSRHYNVCDKKNDKIAKSVQRHGSMLLPMSAAASEKLRQNVLSKMNNDPITLVVKQDDLILKLGSKLMTKHDQDPHLNHYISQKMREMARFLIEIRKIYPAIHNATECINPIFFPKVIEAVRKVSSYNPECGKYGTPSLALKIGHSLKKCANIIISESLINNLPLKREMAQNFIKLCENEWSANISCGALTTIHRNKWNMPDRLPLTEDIKLLNTYLTSRREEYVSLLKNAEVTIYNWSNLAKVVLAQTLLFNRRRAGEVERIPVEVYANKLTADENVDKSISETLSEFEQAISRTFVRFQIRGKRGRGVPILLYPKLIEAYDILMLYRYHVGIPRENPHFFATGPHSHYRGSDVLRMFAIQSGAQQPEALTSTKLRKNVATMSQILNLSNHELDQLATFMGHDIRVHREYYRLPESTIQLAKISKILIAAEKGKLHHFKGKNLDQINVDVNRISDDETSESESERQAVEECENEPNELLSSGTPDDNNVKKQKKRRSKTKVITKKKIWSEEERNVVEDYFSKAILRGKIPGKDDCEDCIIKNAKILENRDWKVVKYYVYNLIQRNKKKSR